MLVHLRLTAPAELSDEVVSVLTSDPWVTNLVVLPGACREPADDRCALASCSPAASWYCAAPSSW